MQSRKGPFPVFVLASCPYPLFNVPQPTKLISPCCSLSLASRCQSTVRSRLFWLLGSLILPKPYSRVGYLSRKALPIKRNDAEPLTREDVQYDLLHYLFSNTQTVFTNPTSPTGPKLTFGDLYAAAIYHSSKCSKVLKDKMSDNPAFNLEFSKFSLLTNIGRINTTMACEDFFDFHASPFINLTNEPL